MLYFHKSMQINMKMQLNQSDEFDDTTGIVTDMNVLTTVQLTK